MMGNTYWGWGSTVHLHAGFVDFAKQHAAEIERPDAIAALLQTDMVFFQRIGQKQQLVLEADRPSVRHPFDQEVARILERWKRRGIGARRHIVPRGRGVAAERGVGALFIV